MSRLLNIFKASSSLKDGKGASGKPVVANMGLPNQMYYNNDLKRWVEPGTEDAIRKEMAELSRPPPKRRSTGMDTQRNVAASSSLDLLCQPPSFYTIPSKSDRSNRPSTTSSLHRNPLPPLSSPSLPVPSQQSLASSLPISSPGAPVALSQSRGPPQLPPQSPAVLSHVDAASVDVGGETDTTQAPPPFFPSARAAPSYGGPLSGPNHEAQLDGDLLPRGQSPVTPLAPSLDEDEYLNIKSDGRLDVWVPSQPHEQSQPQPHQKPALSHYPPPPSGSSTLLESAAPLGGPEAQAPAPLNIPPARRSIASLVDILKHPSAPQCLSESWKLTPTALQREVDWATSLERERNAADISAVGRGVVAEEPKRVDSADGIEVQGGVVPGLLISDEEQKDEATLPAPATNEDVGAVLKDYDSKFQSVLEVIARIESRADSQSQRWDDHVNDLQALEDAYRSTDLRRTESLREQLLGGLDRLAEGWIAESICFHLTQRSECQGLEDLREEAGKLVKAQEMEMGRLCSAEWKEGVWQKQGPDLVIGTEMSLLKSEVQTLGSLVPSLKEVPLLLSKEEDDDPLRLLSEWWKEAVLALVEVAERGVLEQHRAAESQMKGLLAQQNSRWRDETSRRVLSLQQEYETQLGVLEEECLRMQVLATKTITAETARMREANERLRLSNAARVEQLTDTLSEQARLIHEYKAREKEQAEKQARQVEDMRALYEARAQHHVHQAHRDKLAAEAAHKRLIEEQQMELGKVRTEAEEVSTGLRAQVRQLESELREAQGAATRAEERVDELKAEAATENQRFQDQVAELKAQHRASDIGFKRKMMELRNLLETSARNEGNLRSRLAQCEEDKEAAKMEYEASLREAQQRRSDAEGQLQFAEEKAVMLEKELEEKSAQWRQERETLEEERSRIIQKCATENEELKARQESRDARERERDMTIKTLDTREKEAQAKLESFVTQNEELMVEMERLRVLCDKQESQLAEQAEALQNLHQEVATSGKGVSSHDEGVQANGAVNEEVASLRKSMGAEKALWEVERQVLMNKLAAAGSNAPVAGPSSEVRRLRDEVEATKQKQHDLAYMLEHMASKWDLLLQKFPRVARQIDASAPFVVKPAPSVAQPH